MNTLNELQLSILLALSNSPNCKSLQEITEEYGDESVYNEFKWLKTNNYITNQISFNLSFNKKFFSTLTTSDMPLTEKALNIINSLHV